MCGQGLCHQCLGDKMLPCGKGGKGSLARGGEGTAVPHAWVFAHGARGGRVNDEGASWEEGGLTGRAVRLQAV